MIEKLTAEQWREVSENVHKTVFAKIKPASMDRIDFALVYHRDGKNIGYVTCREQDSETLYWQFGGAFMPYRKTIDTWRGYVAFREWCRSRYKRIHTLVENDNVDYLKMAMKAGFRIIGTQTFNGNVLVTLLLEF